MQTIEDDEVLIDFDQQQAIKKYMAMLKRRANAPQVFTYPKSTKPYAGQSDQEFMVQFTSSFESLNGLKHVPVVFWQPLTEQATQPIEADTMAMQNKTELPAIKQTQEVAINRSLSVLHAMLGITSAPVECATIAPIVETVAKVTKEAKKPAKARKIASITQPADTIKHEHDVWYYLLGKDKKRPRVAA